MSKRWDKIDTEVEAVELTFRFSDGTYEMATMSAVDQVRIKAEYKEDLLKAIFLKIILEDEMDLDDYTVVGDAKPQGGVQ